MTKLIATIHTDDNEIVVRAHVEGLAVDRPELQGWVCTNQKIAERLKAAIEAGVVFHNFSIKPDINGKTYLSASSRVLGRMMNADLKRLGF